MYFDFEDYRPDTPSLTAPMTRREAVLLALLLHAVLVIMYLVTPADWFRARQVIPVSPDSDKQITYTRIEPMRELPRIPKAEAHPALKPNTNGFRNARRGHTRLLPSAGAPSRSSQCARGCR